MTREEIERGVRAVAAIFTRHGVQGPDHDPSPIHLARQWCFGLANEEPRGLITAELYDGVSGRLFAMGCSGERAARQAMVIALEAIAAWDVAVEMTDEAARCFAELIEGGVVPRAAREQALHGTQADSIAGAAQDAACRAAETGERHGVVRDGERYRAVPVLYVAEPPEEGDEPDGRGSHGWDPGEVAVASGGTGRPEYRE